MINIKNYTVHSVTVLTILTELSAVHNRIIDISS